MQAGSERIFPPNSRAAALTWGKSRAGLPNEGKQEAKDKHDSGGGGSTIAAKSMVIWTRALTLIEYTNIPNSSTHKLVILTGTSILSRRIPYGKKSRISPSPFGYPNKTNVDCFAYFIRQARLAHSRALHDKVLL